MGHPIEQHTKDARELAEKRSALYVEISANSDQQAIEFAKLIIQTLLLLHGGGLVAIPTFTEKLSGVGLGAENLSMLVLILAAGLFLH